MYDIWYYEEIWNSDYCFYKVCDSAKNDAEFFKKSEELCEKYGIGLCTIKTNHKGRWSTESTVYVTKKYKQEIKSRIFVKEDINKFSSLISGERKIVFEDLCSFDNHNQEGESKKEVFFLLEGDKKSIDAYRTAVIDEYGISNPVENGKEHTGWLFVILSWVLLICITLILEKIYLVNLKREIAIRLINGTDRKKVFKFFYKSWVLEFVLPFIVLLPLAALFNEAEKFFFIEITALLIVTILTGILYNRTVAKIEATDAYRKNHFSKGTMWLFFAATCLLLVLTLIAIPITVFNISDGLKTFKQRDIWSFYSDYSNAYFMSKGEEDSANWDKDEKHRMEFYNRFLDEYNITLFCAVDENGGSSQADVAPLIYANKNALRNIDHLVKTEKLKPDNYYIISNLNKKELKKEGFYEDVIVAFGDRMGKRIIEKGLFLIMDESYEITVLDINITNLGNNVHKNPLIIVDTHDKFPYSGINGYVLNSILKCSDEKFMAFIDEIGYEDQNYYINNVKEMFEKRLTEKIILITTNSIIMILWLLLFNLMLIKILKEQFKSKGIEIVIKKLNGQSVCKRYRMINRPLILTLVIGSGIAVFIDHILLKIELPIILAGILIMGANVFWNLLQLVKKSEKRNITSILKGDAIH